MELVPNKKQTIFAVYFRNTALSSLKDASLAGATALFCENYPRISKSAFSQGLV